MEQRQDAQITGAWKQHYPYLVDLAFRMLGDIGEAEDRVQEAFSRLIRANSGDVEDARGWLIVVTSRLCLDHMRSARARRERAYDANDIDAVPRADPQSDPGDRVTLDDNVRLALLIVLQRLNPAERVVFVLHDVFKMPFHIVAETVGRPAPTCRQLARRARQKVETSQTNGRIDVSASEHRLVTERFITACMNGDLDRLLEVLAPDAWGDVDLGPEATWTPGVVVGSDRIARNLLRYWGRGVTLVSHPVGDQPAVLAFRDREFAGVLVLTVHEELIKAVHVIADPHALSFLRAQLTPRA
jgi:RNA polymerase sigma-70 factor (ECF subfamily)